MISEILTSIGLTPEQADLYTSLLEHGAQTAGKLAKTTKIQRTYVYPVARELAKKGLVAMEKKGRTTTFIPQPPERLLTQAEDVKTHAAQAFAALEGILPSLKTKYSAAESKPVVSYFEGIEGIQRVYMDTLHEGKPILAIVETSKVDQIVYDWVTTVYSRERVKRGIPVKALVATGPKTPRYAGLSKKEIREIKIFDSKKFPIEHEVNIYGDKLAIINHRKGSRLLGIIIDQPVIAATFRSWFKLTWAHI